MVGEEEFLIISGMLPETPGAIVFLIKFLDGIGVVNLGDGGVL